MHIKNNDKVLTADDARIYLANLSESEFLELGAEDLAYIRPSADVGKSNRSAPYYSIYMADGQKLMDVTDYNEAINIIYGHDMEAICIQ